MRPIRADVYGCVAKDGPGHEDEIFPAQPGVPVPDMRLIVSVCVIGTPLLLLSAIAAIASYFFK